MRVTLIFVLYKTPKKEAERLKREVKSLGFQDYILHFVDNTKNNRGYAAGVNEGIKKGLKNGTDLFIIANPDISLQGLTADRILTAKKSFDVWGFAMKQNGKTYYGGFLDHLRMSGGLNEKKPRVRFFKCDFVSGSLMCIKREVVDMIGLWDESYFLYYEDADYCYRAKRAGFKVGIDSYTAYQHFEASGGSIAKQSYLAKNRIKFLIRYGTFRQKLYELIRLPKTILERQRAFTRNLIFLNASSLFNKILNFILFIFLVRYLTVQEYGVYTLVWTHVALLAPVLDFGTTVYGLVHLPTQKTKKINSLFSLRFALSIIVFVLTLTLAMVFRFRGEVFFFVFLTSFTIFSNMMSGSFLLTSSIREKLVAPSLVSIGFNLALISALIGSLVISTKLPGIFYVIFIAYNFYTVVNYFLLKKQAKSLTLTFDFREWLTILRKSSVYLFISLLAGLYFKLDVFLLNFLKGEEAVGIYTSGYKFLEAFVFLAVSYNFVAMPQFAKLQKLGTNALRMRINKDLRILLSVGILVAFAAFVAFPIILPYVLQGEYLRAITVSQIVIFALPLILIYSIFLNTLYVLEKAHIAVLIFASQAGFNLVLNLIYIPRYSFVASSYITVFGEALNVIITFVLVQKYLRKI